MDKFVPRREVLKILKIHKNTLYQLINDNKMEFIKLKNKNLYNVDKYIRENGLKINIKHKICYCRVSSKKQKEDLLRQIEYMKKLYPIYTIISDIGSSLNFKRKGLLKLIEMSINNEIEEIIIVHKDRLARIGYELIEILVNKYSNAKIKILDNYNNESDNEQITKDIMAIMNVYVAKINGKRKYK